MWKTKIKMRVQVKWICLSITLNISFRDNNTKSRVGRVFFDRSEL